MYSSNKQKIISCIVVFVWTVITFGSTLVWDKFGISKQDYGILFLMMAWSGLGLIAYWYNVMSR